MDNVSETLEYLDRSETLEYLGDELPRLLGEVKRLKGWAAEDASAIPDRDLAETVRSAVQHLASAAESLSRAIAATDKARARFDQLAGQEDGGQTSPTS